MTNRSATAAFALFAVFAASTNAMAAAAEPPLKQAKFIIEHNATAHDTGFQAFIDSEGWERLEIVGPDGPVAEFHGSGTAGALGLTELFFETVEPENAKKPIEQVLATFPEGTYEFRASASELSGTTGVVVGTAELTHAIPAGVMLIEPAADAVLPVGPVTVRWEQSGKAIDGSAIEIIGYQVIVEKDEDPHPTRIGNGLSVYLPASASQYTVAAEFFEPGTPYLWEVLAIEAGGNQTLQSSAFKTE